MRTLVISRPLFVFITTLYSIALAAQTNVAQQDIPDIELEYLTQVQLVGPNLADLEPFSDAGRHMVGRIVSGKVSGPALNGTLLPAGEDWALIRPDGTLEIDVQMLLRTDDGALIRISWKGRWKGSKEVFDRIISGENVEPNEYYLRVAANFETKSPKYAWLNDIIAIGYGKVLGGAGTRMSLFQVK